VLACLFVNSSEYLVIFFSPNNESQNVNMELVLDQKAYLEEINRSLRCVADNLRRRKTTIDVKYFNIFVCVGVMYSGEYNVCDVTQSVHPHLAS
jgi:hypothetical protein